MALKLDKVPSRVFVSEVTVFSARLVEQGIGFGSLFDSARFVAIGAFGYEVISKCAQQLLPNSGAGFGAPSTGDSRPEMTESVQCAFETDAIKLLAMFTSRLSHDTAG